MSARELIKSILGKRIEVKIMHFVFVIGVIVLAAIVGMVSSKYLGPDNAIEQEAEEIIEDQLEVALDLPNESLEGKIDLSATAKQDK